MRTHTRLQTSGGEVHVMNVDPPHPRTSGRVVFSHGFTVPGFESRRMFLDAAERLAARGIPGTLFDYRGSGYSDLAFEEMTLHTEQEDLGLVLEAVRGTQDGPIVVWAMSLGTAIAAKVAGDSPELVDALAFWCSSFDTYERWVDRYSADLEAGGGEIFIPAGFKVTSSLLDSVKDFDLTQDLARSTVPLLLVHGTDDDSTDLGRVQRSTKKLSRPFDLVVIEGGNHGFKNQPEQFEVATAQTLDWIEARICDGG